MIEIGCDAVIFDMDGTLVDSTSVVEALWAEFSERTGADLPAVLRFAHGRRTEETVQRFTTSAEQAQRETDWMQEQELSVVHGIVEIPAARRLMDALDETRIAIVTSASRELARRRLGAAGLPVPGILIAAEDVRAGKPSPEGYLKAMERLGCDASRAVVFEDAAAGLEAARTSGATTVVVGGYEGPASAGLARILDFAGVSVVTQQAGMLIRWEGEYAPA